VPELAPFLGGFSQHQMSRSNPSLRSRGLSRDQCHRPLHILRPGYATADFSGAGRSYALIHVPLAGRRAIADADLHTIGPVITSTLAIAPFSAIAKGPEISVPCLKACLKGLGPQSSTAKVC